ncbi:sigma factor [Dorea formicigenerans]|uniref:sigma factor n=1 Tax=Dorea formicigenerans TaxID=39486 RepID=UPI0022E27636|nr:sigma factor [Dorea formicigenerans]
MVESEDVKKAEIDRLYKENVSKVYRTALYYVEDHYVAEEIVQEVFLIRQPGRYMYGVRACMADHYRKEYGKELSKR